ncbi:MAG: DUF4358 domain-containing protein [Oscillospiraceae bacterium]|nr:DUF4358 domain-containing protein [Oscillospiraceae bacterium]
MSILKKLLAFLLLAAALISLAACSQKAAYKDNVPLEDLAAAVEKHLDGGSLAAMKESYLSGPMKLDTILFADYLVKINAYGANIDEYGIFKARDEKGVADVKKAAEDYLQLRKDTWMEEYMPEEKPKLMEAEVKVCGLYVIYVIVSDEVRSPILSDFENALKA